MKGKVNIVGTDPKTSLADMKKQVNVWIQEFGEDAILTTDAGYNNVTLRIDTRKSVMKKYMKGKKNGKLQYFEG